MLLDLIRVPDPTSIDDQLDEPLGLLSLAAVARAAGFAVRITNLAGCAAGAWHDRLQPADIYGIQLYTPTAHHGVAIARELRSRYPQAKLIAGGAHPSALPDDPALAVFDTLVLGEGEEALVRLLREVQDGGLWPARVQAPFIADLDALPLPARDLLDMQSFHRCVDGERAFGILGSRGCCFRCAFCDQALFGTRLRTRSVPHIAGELRLLRDTYGVRHFEFFDDIFAVNRARLAEFAAATADLQPVFRCNGRTDQDDPQFYRDLHAAGCRMICFGIESGDDGMLQRMNKQTTVANAYRAIELAHAAGLLVNGYFILGFPGETRATIAATRQFISESEIDQAQAYTFVPLPGCEVYRRPRDYGILSLSTDYSRYFLVTGKDGLGGETIATEFLSAAELTECVREFRQFLRERPTRGRVQDYYTRDLRYRAAAAESGTAAG